MDQCRCTSRTFGTRIDKGSATYGREAAWRQQQAPNLSVGYLTHERPGAKDVHESDQGFHRERGFNRKSNCTDAKPECKD